MIVLIRHAVAVARREWEGEDRARPLTARGERQAAALPKLLAGCSMETIVSSPTTRCRATVVPLAEQRELRVKTSKALGEGRGGHALDLVLDTVVDLAVCTHGDVVEEVLQGLRHLGWPIPPRPRMPKGGVWVLQRDRFDFLPPAS